MAYQNINQYNYKKFYLLNKSEIQDFCLASDERDYNLEVIFSDKLIGEKDGNVLPISFDLNNSGSSEFFVLNYNDYVSENNLVSLNYYNPKNLDLTCFSAFSLCDIGITGTDNGLVDQMSGYTINVTQGLFDDSLKFERLYFDRRFKLHQVTGYTQVGVNQFSGLSQNMQFNIVSKLDDKIGIYHELYGGFYQGFYKLHGFDYDIFPERVNKGWSVEMLLKPRLVNEFGLASGETTLNNFYPQNKDIFFYFGTRAENKYYHYADGEPVSGYTRVTSGLGCLETCACCNTGITVSRCIYVYPPTPASAETNNTCGEVVKTCGWEEQTHSCPPLVTTTTTIECSECIPCSSCFERCEPPLSIEYTCETDPLDDSMSNAIALKLCGDPKNPKIGVKILLFTGGCETTGTCENTGITYTTGYTILELCTDKGIYDLCIDTSQEFLNKEKWFLVDVVWERYKNLEDCDLCWKGGLCLITKEEYYESLAGNSVKLIDTSKCGVNETIILSKLNQNWLDEKEFRMGRLKIYVNGRKFQTFENIEEIIPRSLYTEKEKQIGVPFNISWGGGTQGLHNHLIFSGCPTSLTGLTYQQDPELFPNNILSGTSLSALTTNILLEQNFGGTFDGGISQFRMYVEPLSSDEVKHNFKLLKDKFDLFDYDCPNCCLDNDFRFAFCDINYEYLPVNLIELFITYSEGSIIASYNAVAVNNVDTNLNISFINTLGVKNGDPIIFDVSLQIQSGSTTGNTIITSDENYNNLNYESYFSGLTISANSLSNYIFKVAFNFTFIDQILIDPIITDNGEYISVGENEYLQFVDPPPQTILDAILTNIGEYISVGINQFLRFINPLPTPTPTITPTNIPTNTPTPTITDTPTPTPTITESPTLTPTETSTPTPTETTTPLVPLTFYIGTNGESVTFDGITYTSTTSLDVIQNVYYSISCIPQSGYTFFGWNTYGASFIDSNSQSTQVSIFLPSGANFIPSYIESPTPTPTNTPTMTPTPTITPNCQRNIVVPTLWNGVTSINTNQLKLTQTSETLQIQVNDIITDNIGATSFVGIVSSDGTYTYVFTGPGGGVAFNCQFPLTFSGPC